MNPQLGRTPQDGAPRLAPYIENTEDALMVLFSDSHTVSGTEHKDIKIYLKDEGIHKLYEFLFTPIDANWWTVNVLSGTKRKKSSNAIKKRLVRKLAIPS